MRLRHVAGLLVVGAIWSCAEGTDLDAPCTTEWFRDNDGDGYGDSTVVPKIACERPAGYVREGGDCNDKQVEFHPGAEEDCAVDEDLNCDGSTGFTDADMDGVAACEDCDDTDANRYPGATEICDGIDNDCDQLVDTEDVPDEMLCDAVANATPTCEPVDGCSYACEAPYVDVNQDLIDGCECYPQPDEPGVGDSCETAFNLGDLVDGNADSIIINGNTPWAATERWYRFNAVDDVDTNGDEFHVDVRFMDNPNGSYAMAVYRGDCPANSGEELAVEELDIFDWFTNFPFTTTGCTGPSPCGEGDCSDVPSDSVNLCQDDSAPFYVRIVRLDGAPSCELFSLQFSNGVY